MAIIGVSLITAALATLSGVIYFAAIKPFPERNHPKNAGEVAQALSEVGDDVAQRPTTIDVQPAPATT